MTRMLRGRVRAVLLLLPALVLLLFAPASAHALSVSVPLDDLLGEYAPGGEIRVVEWDVGVEFAEIEEITLAIGADSRSVIPTLVPILRARIYTGPRDQPIFFWAASFESRTEVLVFRPAAPSRFEIDIDPGQRPSLAQRILLWSLPDYEAFRSGRGLLDFWYEGLIESGLPNVITSAQLTVIGTVVPEPATVAMVGIGLAALVLRRRRSFAIIAGFAMTVSIQEAHAAQSVPVTLTVEPELWLLNGNPTGQPLVPMLQQIDAGSRTFTENLTLVPTRTAVTGATIPASLAGGGTAAYSRTPAGSAILFPNAGNRFDPFTLTIWVTARNGPGQAIRSQGRLRAEVPVDLGVRMAVDVGSGIGGAFLVADLDIPGALGDPSAGTVMFSGNIALLSIPIDGTAHPHRFTSDEVTIMRTLGKNCRPRPPPGLPSDCETLTFSAAGSVAPNRLTLVTPVVIDIFSGEGADRTPTSVLGFLKVRAEGNGIRFVPEPNAVAMLALGLAGVVARSRRRRRPRHPSSAGGIPYILRGLDGTLLIGRSRNAA